MNERTIAALHKGIEYLGQGSEAGRNYRGAIRALRALMRGGGFTLSAATIGALQELVGFYRDDAARAKHPRYAFDDAAAAVLSMFDADATVPEPEPEPEPDTDIDLDSDTHEEVPEPYEGVYRKLDLDARTSTTLTFTFGFTGNRDAMLEVWPKGNRAAAVRSKPDESGKYGGPGNDHRQTVGSLTPSVTYRVITLTRDSADGEWYQGSPVKEFKTDAEMVIVTPPLGIDLARPPFMGRAVGSASMGGKTAHTKLSQSRHMVTQMFMPRGGEIEAMAFHARYGSGYAVGNGGNWLMAVRETLDGFEVGDRIGQSDPGARHVMKDGKINASNLVWVQMRDRPSVDAGVAYWIERSCLDDGNYAVWNGMSLGDYVQSVPGIGQRGFWPGDESERSWRLKWRAKPGDAWRDSDADRANTIPMVFVKFTDGEVYGVTDTAVGRVAVDNVANTASSSNVSTHRYIGGNRRARMVWRQDGDMLVRDARLRYSHNPNAKRITGAAMNVVVAESDGARLGAATMPAVPELFERQQSPDWWVYLAKTRGVGQFTDPVALQDGREYSVELSAEAMDYMVDASAQWINKDATSGNPSDANRWRESRIEYSDDDGRTWGQWNGTLNAFRELPIVLSA